MICSSTNMTIETLSQSNDPVADGSMLIDPTRLPEWEQMHVGKPDQASVLSVLRARMDRPYADELPFDPVNGMIVDIYGFRTNPDLVIPDPDPAGQFGIGDALRDAYYYLRHQIQAKRRTDASVKYPEVVDIAGQMVQARLYALGEVRKLQGDYLDSGDIVFLQSLTQQHNALTQLHRALLERDTPVKMKTISLIEPQHEQ